MADVADDGPRGLVHGAAAEGAVADVGERARQVHVGEAGAADEGALADVGERVRQVHLGEAGAAQG